MKENKPGLGRMWSLYKKGGITPAVSSMFNNQNAQQMAFIRSVMKNQRKKAISEMPLNQLEVVVFDLETTGFSPNQGDEIISIGAVLVEGTEVIKKKKFYTVTNPKREIPENIVKLTGITNEMALKGAELIEALHNFLGFVNKRVLLAHGTGHDKQFLNSALWKTSRIRLSHRVLDTMIIGKWLHPEVQNYDLDTLLNIYDIPISNRHHALEDSLMTAQLWTNFLEKILKKNIFTLGDLYAYLSK
ncbi:exonuclease domain-containing protein [Chengkuizengella axinellae]|uniref:Exonuclease domain-containing protein n=1 Tax=Chengkuizengella axinellae TaxID=3064388 RepID=A0ABT9IZ05_9BACL|nr:exonuclease domain-containing protein [Chengkuizengella sp. 2205SS18-9]MDP5274550.1 exonuclease domain-containing protein [Chengkuizengella sp. 2205SS18-9]